MSLSVQILVQNLRLNSTSVILYSGLVIKYCYILGPYMALFTMHWSYLWRWIRSYLMNAHNNTNQIDKSMLLHFHNNTYWYLLSFINDYLTCHYTIYGGRVHSGVIFLSVENSRGFIVIHSRIVIGCPLLIQNCWFLKRIMLENNRKATLLLAEVVTYL